MTTVTYPHKPRRRRIARGLASFALAAALAILSSGARHRATLQVPIVQVQLENGLRVVMSEDRSAPVVAVVVYYDVGSRNEVKGRSGFAHLFEHMMFQGSRNVRKGEYFSLIETNGGTFNGSTQLDHTNYYEFLPSNQLELALWLESDRMRSLAITRANLNNQREAVKEEKRLRIDNQAYWPALTMMDEMLFHNWAFAHPTIGSMQDLDSASVSDVKSFFSTYYSPNNAVIAIAGDIEYRLAETMVRKYFEPVSRRPAPPPVELTEPPGVVRASAVVADPHAQVPAIIMAWKLPDKHEFDAYAVTLLKALLTDGASSRLYRRLVKSQPLALEVQGFSEVRRGPGALTLFVINKRGVRPEEAQEIIEEEIDRLKNEAVTEDELRKVKSQYRLNRLIGGGAEADYESLQTPLGRALEIGGFALLERDPNLINTDLDRYLSVTTEQIREAARKHFGTTNRSIIYITPQSQTKN